MESNQKITVNNKTYFIKKFDDISSSIPITRDFWNRTKDMSNKEITKEIRKSLKWPEGFLENLAGLPLDKQMDYYCISETTCCERTSYGKITNENMSNKDFTLKEYPGLRSLVVENGVIIGVCIDGYNPSRSSVAFPYVNICTYIASDNNGSGTKDRSDYAHLYCIMPK